MISVEHARLMARYNRWQNENLYEAAAGLTDEARRHERGAFFGSIHGTLSHLLWGDSVWMHRFSGSPLPQGGIKDSATLCADWDDLVLRRKDLDEAIVRWSADLTPPALEGSITWYSGALGREVTRPTWALIAHFFNHQTHHRGQVHAMLTAAGAKPGDTDLMIIA